MDRKNVIDRLVKLKLAAGSTNKAFCICLAGPAKAASKK
jgi:hypothetical protein